MTNTETLFRRLLKYQNERGAARDEFEHGMKMVEQYRGSAGYDREIAKLESKYHDTVEALQRACYVDVDAIIRAMRDAIGNRAIEPPTEEQARILQTIKLRENISRGEVEQLIMATRGNALALQTLHDILNSKGITAPIAQHIKQLSNERAEDIVDGLAEQCRDFIKHDEPRARRIAAQFNNHRYGTVIPEGRRPRFEDKSQFYKQIANYDESDVSLLSEAVDGGCNA